MTSTGDLSLEFRLLGPFQVAATGRVIEIGSTKQRAVLAVLAVRLNRPVPSETLIEEIWGGHPPASVQSTLQSLVYRLRRALADAGAEAAGVGLRRRGSTYVLEADELQLDARRFERLLARGRELLAAGAADGAARALSDALDLWRGPPLDDLGDLETIRLEATRLEEARLAAVEALADAELARDRPSAAVALLEPHVARYPLREGAWGQLMLALYRLGRQADALRAYQELRRVLGEELGIEPNPSLRELEQRILRQSPELTVAPRSAASDATPTEYLPASDGAEGSLSTVVFTDVEDSTALRSSRGDDTAHRILRQHEHLVRKLLAEHHGREVKALGDGFLAVFGSGRRALAFAAALQRSLEEERWTSPAEAVRMRIGVNAGEVVEEGGDIFGQAVHAAARIAAKAEGGQILVSEVVIRLVGAAPDTTFRDMGRFRLKGFPERWRLFEFVWSDTVPAGAPAGTLSPAGRIPLVGRASQMQELEAALDRAMAGTGGLVTICGEAGIGKSRLTEELIAEGLKRRALVFVGRCSEAEGAASYAPVIEILEAALAQAPTPEVFRTALGDDAAEIARLLPRLRRLFPDIGPALELPPEQERRYLFNSTADFLARTARARPTMLVYEDLHWADEATLLMLDHLVSQVAALPVLIVGTYRDVELDERPLLARTLEGLVRRRLVHQIRLGRLAESDVAGMLSALAGHEAPVTVVDVVFSETEGNPFLVEEMFKYLVDEGRLLDADGQFRPDVKIQELDVPENVRLVVGRRLDRLAEDTRRVLGSAAVIGRYFRYEVLEAAAGLPTDAVLDAVDEAERAHLIVAAPGDAGGERFGFSHELVRQTVLTRISAPRRRRLHLAVADALEMTLGRTLEEHASDIAHHLVEAGAAAAPIRTLRYLVLAGRRALAASGFEDALRYFEQAVALDAGDTAERADLLVDLSRAQRSVGRWDVALATSLDAIETFEELDDTLAVGRVCADAAYGLAWLARFGDAYEMARRGLRAVTDLATPERGYLLAVFGMVSAYSVSYEDGRAAIDAAAAVADRVGDPRLVAYVADQRGHVEWGAMRHREAVAAAREAADGLAAVGDVWERAMVLGFMLFSLVQLGRFAEADDLRDELEPLARRLGCYPALLFCHRARLLTDLCRTADLSRLEEAAAEDLEINEAIGGAWSGQSHTWRGLVHFWRGEWAAAGTHFEEGARRDPDGALNGWGWAWLFQHRAYTGAGQEARRLLAERESDLPRPGGPNRFGPWTMLGAVVEGLVVLGEDERAAEHYPVLVEALDAGVVGGNYHDVRLFERVAGIAAAAGGRFDEAEAHFSAALRLADELPHHLEGLETRRFYARMLLARDQPGDRQQAVKLLDEAAAGYRKLGMPEHVALTAI
jgi:DNA-binding SARP family transcriptional activator